LILLDTEAGAVSAEKHEAEQGMIDMWLSVGPVDDLANAVADLIIADPDLNAQWVAKWQARPNEALRQPSVCLQGRDSLLDRLAEITCPALVIHGSEDHAIEM